MPSRILALFLATSLAAGAHAQAGGEAATAPQPAATPAEALPPPPSADDWKTFARQDIEAAYSTYRAIHPGMLDPANPGFPRLLEQARAQGLAEAEQVNRHGAYSRALAAFSAVLNDGHAVAVANPIPPHWQPPVQAEWPGFLPVWRDGVLVVGEAGPASPVPVGTRILACDGLAIREFLIQRLRSRYLRGGEEGQFWDKAPFAFWTAATTPNRAQSCRMRTPDGAERDVPINWIPAPEDWIQRYTLAVQGDRLPIGLTEPRPGIFLIALQDFQPNDEGMAAYRRLFAEVERRRAELSGARAVVLDLRNNNGGNSSWPQRLAERIWGKAEVDGAMDRYFAGTEVWWRPVDETLAQLQPYADMARRQGEADSAARQDAFIATLAAARDRGQPWHVEKFGDLALRDRDLRPRATSFRAPVYVITPGRCASACLDALDIFTRFERVKLIGAPTSGDSTYMQIWMKDLPSGRGRLVVPVKVWVNRPRGNGEIYQPSIVMSGMDWSTPAFLDRIERDLPRR